MQTIQKQTRREGEAIEYRQNTKEVTALLQQILHLLDEPTLGCNFVPDEPVSEVGRALERVDESEILLDVEWQGKHYTLVRCEVAGELCAGDLSAELDAGKEEVHLSPREQEIVRLVAKGYPNKTIAGILEISQWTVGTHLRRIFAKLSVSSRAEMVANAMMSGLVRGIDGLHH